MTNPSLTPAPAPVTVGPVDSSQTLTQTPGKIITVPGIPGHFIQVIIN